MVEYSKKITIMGLNDYLTIIDKIIEEIGNQTDNFDIKLILTEAITNAFLHGNGGDPTKFIAITYLSNDSEVVFTVQDEGKGFDVNVIPNEISDDDLLNESCRGLYIIKQLSDKLETKDNALVITKNLNKSVA